MEAHGAAVAPERGTLPHLFNSIDEGFCILDSIFGLFVQVGPQFVRRQGGLGIGLSLVRTMVHLHGGQVEARSAGPGQGSEFIVRLPAVTGQGQGDPLTGDSPGGVP